MIIIIAKCSKQVLWLFEKKLCETVSVWVVDNGKNKKLKARIGGGALKTDFFV